MTGLWFFLLMTLSAPLLVWISGMVAERARPLDDHARGTFRRKLSILAIASAVAALAGSWAIGSDAFGAGSGFAPYGAAIVAFHLLWWPLARPALAALGRDGARDDGRVRAASLRPRRARDYTPPSMGRVLAALFVAGTVALSLRAWSVEPAAEALLLAGAFYFAAILPLVLLPAIASVEAAAPQRLPADGDEAARLERELDALRAWRLRWFFALEIALASLFFGLAWVAIGSEPNSRTIGLVGGIGGALSGLLGAAFGIAAFARARRMRPDPDSTAGTAG